MSWRKFAVLVRGLPDSSRTVTAQIDAHRDEPKSKKAGPAPTLRWGPAEYVLADVFDAVRALQSSVVAVAQAQSGSKKSVPAPKPYPRPTDRRSALSRMTYEEQLALLRWHERNAGIAPPEDEVPG